MNEWVCQWHFCQRVSQNPINIRFRTVAMFLSYPCYPNMRALPLRLSHFFPQNFRPLGRHFSYCPLHTHDCCTNCTQECLVGITRKVHPGAGGANILQLQMSVTLTAPLLSPPLEAQLTRECSCATYISLLHFEEKYIEQKYCWLGNIGLENRQVRKLAGQKIGRPRK